MLARLHPEAAQHHLHCAEEDVHRMWDLNHYFSQMPGSKPLPEEAEAKAEEPVAAQGGEES